MKVVILCGGMGTRLREETEFRPKPMVEIGGRPILWHILKLYGHYGYRDFVLCLGYKGNLIKEYFLNYDEMNNDIVVNLGDRTRVEVMGRHEEEGFRITLADTGQSAQTGARVKRIQRFIDEDTFMLTYGDGLADIDVPALLAYHKSHGKLATVTSTLVPGRFGSIDTQKDGRVRRFREKPAEEAWISAGFFVFNKGVFDVLKSDDSCILEREPLERLASEGQLMAYRHKGDFFPMDTYRDHVALNELWSSGKARWKVWS